MFRIFFAINSSYIFLDTLEDNPFYEYFNQEMVKGDESKAKGRKKLERAQVHAVVSVARLATTSTVIMFGNSKKDDYNPTKDATVASAVALIVA